MQTNMETMLSSIEEFDKVMKSVTGFRIPDYFKTGLENVAAYVRNGREKEAVAAGHRLVASCARTLAAFIRNAIIDSTYPDGNVRPAIFFEEMDIRRERGYNSDILARLDKVEKKLLEAIHVETNGTFSARIGAYNDLRAAFKEADAEQARREHKREKGTEAKCLAEEAERNRQVAEAQRQHAAAEREARAMRIMSLINR